MNAKVKVWSDAGCTIYVVPDTLMVAPVTDFFETFAIEKGITTPHHVERDDNGWALVVHDGDATKMAKIKDDEKAKTAKAARDAAAVIGVSK